MTEPGDRERRAREEKSLSGLADAYRKAAPYTAASTSLVVAVGGCTWLGHLADEHFGLEVPWLTMVGAALGMTAGFISFFRTVLGNAKKP
jgi:F0F1-type ATP synthase assembly protein I